MSDFVHVVAGAIRDGAGRVLVTRRHDHSHQGGLWEFPGGKLKNGEPAYPGLARELREELAIRVSAARPLIRVRHDYGDREVLLDVWEIERFRGTPRGMEDQPLRWVPPDELPGLAMPAADRPIVTALRLPPHYLITGEDPEDRAGFLSRLERCLETGLRLVQLRAPALDERALAALAPPVRELCRRHGARVLLNGPPELAYSLGLDGVHLSARRLAGVGERPLPEALWVGASCHDAGELARAEAVGADFATVSPVRRTASHPAARPLGWRRFATLCEGARLPVFALGGMRPADTGRARDRGGQGVAGISAWWPRPARR